MSNNPSELHGIFQAIGTLGAKLDGLSEKMIDSERRHAEAERANAEERARLTALLSDLSHRTSMLDERSVRMDTTFSSHREEFKKWAMDFEARLDAVEDSARNSASQIETMRPTVDMVGKWQQRGIGIGAALSALSLVAGAALATFRENLWRMFIEGGGGGG